MRETGGLPESIGPYAIESQIAKGALGTLVLARERGRDEPVALRILKPVLTKPKMNCRKLLRCRFGKTTFEHVGNRGVTNQFCSFFPPTNLARAKLSMKSWNPRCQSRFPCLSA